MLVTLTLAEIARICEGELVGDDAPVNGVQTDTRANLQGSLFLALKGESFDGHDYLAEAINQGAAGVLTQVETSVKPAVKVADTLTAYGKIANYLRHQFTGKVIAITGSNGKTTVKDWLSQCLSSQHKVLKTQANNNNQVGVPLTLCSLQNEHEVAIIEAGTSYKGEIPKLAKIIEPQIAVITNASGSHLDGLGSLEGIAIEKGALLSGLSTDGVAVLNRDDPWFDYWFSLVVPKKCISFGFSPQADMFASDIKLHKSGSTCVIQYRLEKWPLALNVPGKHQIANAMAVLICLLKSGFSMEQGIRLLREPLHIAGRLEFVHTKQDFLLLNDCYNASPTSVEAAIDVLSYQEETTKWLVLGALKELGANEHQVHKALGEYAFQAGINRMICLGPVAAIAAGAFESLGGQATICESHAEIITLLQHLGKDNAVLVKGARSSRMEKIIEKMII
ncbi:UDP-N-acetylmuramoyl-tripeptide--D-alanyl-D-alanine ligase [Marinomonas agarivorans]|nr:UDP-N-acetylmuramoyl-tripeptide--D-alanyl-D-alanine ligase [Marinomonas agarivorans]